MKVFRSLVLSLVFLLPLAVQAQREKLPPDDLEIVEKRWPEAKRTGTGLRSVVLTAGTGESPKPGDNVTVTYSGKLLDGTIFDENLDPARAFTFRLGRGLVIDGWEEGIQLMKVGEKRLFVVPFELAYGTKGNPPKIPRRATLVFEVELHKIEHPDPLPGASTPPPPEPKKKRFGLF